VDRENRTGGYSGSLLHVREEDGMSRNAPQFRAQAVWRPGLPMMTASSPS